jgi:hypothetical protein
MESVKVYNPEPTFISAKNAITPETAKLLMELVDEKGQISSWYENPKCLEFQIANPFGEERINDHRTMALLPELFGLAEKCMRHINASFKNSAFEIATGHHGFWVLRYDTDGQFEKHCDFSSEQKGISPPVVATASILLNNDFDGGDMIVYDSTGNPSMINRDKLKYGLNIWDGFTQHKVTPITSGKRYALIIHYTGKER